MSKRGFRFSLLSLIAAITLCALWLGRESYRAAKVRELREKAAALGGVLVHQHQIVNGKIDLEAHPPVPAVIRDTLDEGWYEKPDALYLSYTAVRDKDLEFLIGFEDIPWIDLGFTDISDQALKYVCRVSKLEALLLTNTRISDEGIKELQHLTNLKALDIRNTRVSDESWKILKTLPLKELWVTGARVTKKAVNEFRRAKPDCVVEYIE